MNNERKKRWRWRWMVVLGFLAALLAYMYWPTGSVKIIISRETTYITRPLNPDGTPNYVAYLDANYAEGVTPENNAAPLLLRAFGADMLSSAFFDIKPEKKNEILARLGLPADILDGDKHFVTWKNCAESFKAPAKDANSSRSDTHERPTLGEVYNQLLAGKVHPDLEAWLARNAGPLELIRQASAKDRLYVPLVSHTDPPTIEAMYYQPGMLYFDAPDALAASAILKMSRNDLRGAWDDVLVVHRLARVRNSGPGMDGRLVTMWTEELAAKSGICLATRGRLPAGEMRGLLNKLSAFKPVGGVIAAYDNAERLAMLDRVMLLYRTKEYGYIGMLHMDLPDVSDLDWNQMLRSINYWYDQRTILFGQLQSQATKGSVATFGTFLGDSYKIISPVGPPSRLRNWLLDYGGRPFRAARTDWATSRIIYRWDRATPLSLDSEDQANMTHEIEILALALACYQVENGRWPAELKELCPSLLKAIPTDRFSGKPLIYRPSKDGCLLYSIGKNGEDDGGRNPPNDARQDDIVAEVKPAEAASKPTPSQP